MVAQRFSIELHCRYDDDMRIADAGVQFLACRGCLMRSEAVGCVGWEIERVKKRLVLFLQRNNLEVHADDVVGGVVN